MALDRESCSAALDRRSHRQWPVQWTELPRASDGQAIPPSPEAVFVREHAGAHRSGGVAVGGHTHRRLHQTRQWPSSWGVLLTNRSPRSRHQWSRSRRARDSALGDELTSVSSLAPTPSRSAIVIGHLVRQFYLLQSPENGLLVP